MHHARFFNFFLYFFILFYFTSLFGWMHLWKKIRDPGTQWLPLFWCFSMNFVVKNKNNWWSNLVQKTHAINTALQKNLINFLFVSCVPQFKAPLGNRWEIKKYFFVTENFYKNSFRQSTMHFVITICNFVV
jgi:hypothetical protein